MIIYILITLLLLGIIITVHEFGHFIACRIFGVGVKEFSLGMGNRILSHQGKRTLYSLKLIPFGGSCSLLDETGTETPQNTENTDGEKSFYLTHPAKRLLILLAGPFFNLILAFIVMIIITALAGSNKATVYFADETSVIREGDEITSINGFDITLGKDITLYETIHPIEDATPLNITIKRSGEEMTFLVDPSENEGCTFGSVVYSLPFLASNDRVNLGILDTLDYSSREFYYCIRSLGLSLKLICSGQYSVKDISGPVGMVSIVKTATQTNKSAGFYYQFLTLLYLLGFLSANIGLVNLIPFPVLDGGRILLLLPELLFKKRLPKKAENLLIKGSTIILLGFMIFVVINDVIKML